jgi:O-acetyl-ADP-ribose deacetylase (regulator of RNase III)
VKIISEGEAIRNILGERKRYAVYLGAGASAEAGVMTADAICQMIRDDVLRSSGGLDLSDPEAAERWANQHLNWGDTSRRYVTCIRRGYPNEARRVEYFRRLLRGIRPSFCHETFALLVSRGYLGSTCLTTNFDHLLESAFMRQGVEFQAIRSEGESQYWQNRDDRFFVLKLHGDIDTLNILNTRDETIAISRELYRIFETQMRGAGLVVLGTAGNEKSVRALFDDLGRRSSGANELLSFGLLWGVYMGTPRPKAITQAELERRVIERVEAGEVNRDIVEMLDDSRNELFCFFPVWGAGDFMLELVKATGDKSLIGTATLRLDHEMRLRHIFANAGLSDEAVEQHLSLLRKQRRSLAERASTPTPEADLALSAEARADSTEVRVLYGDITSRSMMGAEEFRAVRRAVVSPEDTFISAGGGVAYQLLEKAGPELVLNELAKFAPIAQRSVAVTSAGALPVHYVFHAATLEIAPDATYRVSKDDVTATALAILDKTSALDVGVVWVPLLGAGVASLEPRESFEGLLEAVGRWHAAGSASTRPGKLTIAIVIYHERQLSRGDATRSVQIVLGSHFIVRQGVQTTAAA